MNLLEQYRQKIAKKHYAEDRAQLAVIIELQKIADVFCNSKPSTTPIEKPTGFLGKLFSKPQTETTQPWIKGLYCWGGVGRGKTFMMDLFFDNLPTERKRRRHFHRFMLEIQDHLNRLGNIQNPMDTLVKEMAAEIDILCLDEFFVSDITHAMILDRLLMAMQKNNITMVTTSNIRPSDLYKNGLQRERFLPAIAWIEENLQVLHIDAGEDFRLRHFSAENIFRMPDTEANRNALKSDLLELTGNTDNHHHQDFAIGSRHIPVVWRSQDAILFDFEYLCRGNYSQKDYIDIAKRFEYVGVAGVPIMDEELEDAARRFLLLIDEFYDRRVKLLLTTATSVDKLYQGKKMIFEFDRLQSRLFDMQSAQYWQEAHLP